MHRPLLKKPRNPLASNQAIEDEEDDGDDVNDDFHIGYRRPKLVECDKHCDHLDDELSDYVTTRLLIARMLAMRKYDEKWG